ncbi:MAG: Rrf2 family transcriptional regulator [Lachnospiraceae bacterium]|nr:Rrf2 family transcriptional regulator [Lachnospiraceae bacterium]
MISTKGRYAIRLMIDLAEQEKDTPVSLDSIASRQDISKKYLESIVKTLVTGKLVKGISGKKGGYSLTRSPEEYNIMEILKITEGSMATVACLEDNAQECPRKDQCRTLSMWRDYDKLVNDYFSNITIADLMKST